MEFLSELGLFTAKTILIVAGIIVVIGAIFYFSQRGKGRKQLEIEKLNKRYRAFRRALQGQLLSQKDFKAVLKEEKKSSKKEEPRSTRIFVIDFHGDIRASAVNSLREEVTAILTAAKPGDEVVVRLESPGGMVTSYGLAASQLARIKANDLRLTVCVDKVAASGGYMMACVADRIIAAPFAVVGSIGVVAQVPNVHRLLKKHDVEYREVTAGQYKRTVSVFGEITEPGLEKFKEQIEDTHVLFKKFVSEHRPQLDIDKVATGEHWYGAQALDLKLVDSLMTSDDYLFDLHERADLFQIRYHGRKRISERLSEGLGRALHKAAIKILSDLENLRFGL